LLIPNGFWRSFLRSSSRNASLKLFFLFLLLIPNGYWRSYLRSSSRNASLLKMVLGYLNRFTKDLKIIAGVS
jgi:hypothetical protein